MKILSNWYATPAPDNTPYTAPELCRICLVGRVSGHPGFADGQQIMTSPIETANGRTVQTIHGTEYVLEEPMPSYREWLKVNRPNWDPENPITVRTPTGGTAG